MNVEYGEGIPGELEKYFKKNKRNLIVLDNLMDEASKSLEVTQLFTGSCHDNLFVIYLTQNFWYWITWNNIQTLFRGTNKGKLFIKIMS